MLFGGQVIFDVDGMRVEVEPRLSSANLVHHSSPGTQWNTTITKEAWARLRELPDEPGATVSITEYDLELTATRNPSGNRRVTLRIQSTDGRAHGPELHWFDWDQLTEAALQLRSW